MPQHPEDRSPDEQPNGIAGAVEEAAGEQLGVRHWDRPAIFREVADAASDDSLPYWLALGLSAGIATLGLAQNSSAVVIGAMLVAPLLAPIMGLALAMAVGDIRLAVQTGLLTGISVALVIGIAWALTELLPFQTVTLEIAARTRPTTLDLAIAIFSGIVGAVVTVARGSRLSAAIPGVALAVALIPPLAVAGFGLGLGFDWEMIYGSLLLFGANLAGIVLSSMVVFLLVGMHRHGIADVARIWHDESRATGIARLAQRLPVIERFSVLGSARARIGLVIGFAVLLGIPLSESLDEIAREVRVEMAVRTVADSIFTVEGRSSIIHQQITYGAAASVVHLRVATAEWFGDDERVAFERRTSGMAGEDITLTLEQVPSGEDLEQFAGLLLIPGDPGTPAGIPTSLPEALRATRQRLAEVARGLALPDSTVPLEMVLAISEHGTHVITMVYLSPDSLDPQARSIVERQIAGALGIRGLRVEFGHIPARAREVSGADDPLVSEVAVLARRFARAAVLVLVPKEAEPAAGDLVAAFAEAGVPENRLITRVAAGPLRVRLVSVPPSDTLSHRPSDPLSTVQPRMP